MEENNPFAHCVEHFANTPTTNTITGRLASMPMNGQDYKFLVAGNVQKATAAGRVFDAAVKAGFKFNRDKAESVAALVKQGYVDEVATATITEGAPMVPYCGKGFGGSAKAETFIVC